MLLMKKYIYDKDIWLIVALNGLMLLACLSKQVSLASVLATYCYNGALISAFFLAYLFYRVGLPLYANKIDELEGEVQGLMDQERTEEVRLAISKKMALRNDILKNYVIEPGHFFKIALAVLVVVGIMVSIAIELNKIDYLFMMGYLTVFFTSALIRIFKGGLVQQLNKMPTVKFAGLIAVRTFSILFVIVVLFSITTNIIAAVVVSKLIFELLFYILIESKEVEKPNVLFANNE